MEFFVYIFWLVYFFVYVKFYKDNCIYVYISMVKDIILNFLLVKYFINIRLIKFVYKIRNNVLSFEVDWKEFFLRECIGIM